MGPLGNIYAKSPRNHLQIELQSIIGDCVNTAARCMQYATTHMDIDHIWIQSHTDGQLVQIKNKFVYVKSFIQYYVSVNCSLKLFFSEYSFFDLNHCVQSYQQRLA